MNATERSIFEQFDFWRALPPVHIQAQTGRFYAVVGCGTSFYLAMTIASALNSNGYMAVAVPGREWTIRSRNYHPGPDVTVITVSRSGESTETVAAARESRIRGQKVVAISCEPDSSLVREADEALVARTHPEEGIVMTSSASLMLLMGLQFAHVAIDPEVLANQAEAQLLRVRNFDLSDFAHRRHFVFLGGGDLYGLAAEGALKLMEMGCTPTQVFHPLEYRHGPISLVDDGVAAVMLYSEDSAAEAEVASELQKLGAIVLGLGGPGSVSVAYDAIGADRGPVLLPALQWLGETVAQQKQIDTEQPRHLTKVVQFS